MMSVAMMSASIFPGFAATLIYPHFMGSHMDSSTFQSQSNEVS